MKLRAVGFSENGRGDLRGTLIAMSDDGSLLGFEDSGNWSDMRQRERLVAALCKQFSLTEDKARNSVEKVLIQVRGSVDGADPATRPAPPTTPPLLYQATERGIEWLKQTQIGVVPTVLTNFTAHIVADVKLDDGTDTTRAFEIEATLGGKTAQFTVPAAQFIGMRWAIEHLGAGAIVAPGIGASDHARAAIQHLSGAVSERHIFTHTGWRRVNGSWAYLHAGGAIGPEGPVSGIQVDLQSPLDRFLLPDPPEGEERKRAIRASLQVLCVASLRVTVPVYGAVWRAPLGAADINVCIVGATGAGKSEEAALGQQHYGAGFTAKNLPAAWSWTANALETLAFTAKDALLVIDDFAPSGGPRDQQRLHQAADRVFRAQGNRSGRGRLQADGVLRPVKPPRGLILSTGEDVPEGQSIRARTLICELPKEGPGAMDWRLLQQCQHDAAGGLYAQAMAAYLQWLAPSYEDVQHEARKRVLQYRERAYEFGMHRRTPEVVANLACGLRYFLDFALEAGAITREEAEHKWEEWWTALGEASGAQRQYLAGAEPTGRFLELVQAALASGAAHLAAPDGLAPPEPQRCGWRSMTLGPADLPRKEWQPQGRRIGWLEDANVYLQADAAYAEAQRLVRDSGGGLVVSLHTLRRRLREKGFLASVENRGGTEHLGVRKTMEGARREVLHLHADSLWPSMSAEMAQVAQIAHEKQAVHGDGNAADADSANRGPLSEEAQKSGPRIGAEDADFTTDGSDGPLGPVAQHYPNTSEETEELRLGGDERCPQCVSGSPTLVESTVPIELSKPLVKTWECKACGHRWSDGQE